jgi:outer membrane protein assembly factor BamB
MASAYRQIMKRIFIIVLAGILPWWVAPASAESWPGWRGPRADGTSLDKNVPLNWDPSNAAWKTEIPGQGHASPIVLGNLVCTATALPETQERSLLCLDRGSGKILWQKTVVQGPLEKKHEENSYASSTPTTDGQRIYAAFRVGDELVVAAHELATGKPLWLVRPGEHVGEWGYSGQPVLYKDKLIVDGDSKGKSFLVALNCADGKEAWRLDRTNKGISYSAPFIHPMGGRTQMIQCGDRCVTSFDPDTGNALWTVTGPSQEFVASPVYSENAGLVFISSSWPKSVLLAIRPDGSGDVSSTQVVWRDEKGAPYVPSLTLADNFLLSVNTPGTAFCYEAPTGKVLWQEKLGRHHASPVVVRGLVYFINDKGQINAVKPGPRFDCVATYELGEANYASPAISDGQVFLRGFNHLFCIGQRTSDVTP